MPPSFSAEIISLVLGAAPKTLTLTAAQLRLHHVFTPRCRQRARSAQGNPFARRKVVACDSGKIPSCPILNPNAILDRVSFRHALESCEGNGETDGLALVALLNACAKLKDLDACQRIEALLERQALLGENVYVNGSLIHAYMRCSCLSKARDLFEKIRVRSIVVWTVMVSGLVEHGLDAEALLYYRRMQEQATTSLDVGMVVCISKACGSSIGTMTSDGFAIHHEVVARGLDRQHASVPNCLIDMYAKCGSICEARVLFEALASQQDVVAWNSLIGGYVEHGFQEEALHCLGRMQEKGILPSAITLVCILKACGATKALGKAQAIHSDIIRKGILEIDAFIGTALVDVYAKCMSFEESLKVFEALPVKDVVAWNALISVYSNQRRGHEAIQCFEQMQSANVVPDSITFSLAVKVCNMTGAVEKAQEVCAQIIDSGLEREVTIRTSLVDMYCTFGMFQEAEELLSKFRDRNTTVCWNALITGYETQGHHKKAVTCFKKIVFDSMVPDEVTFTASLRACGSLGCMSEGQRTHSLIVMRGLEEDLVVGSTAVSMYTKCGSPDEARAAFRSLSRRNVVSWTSLMEGHAQLLGEQEQVFDAFGSMIKEGVDPDPVSILSLLAVCDHAGLVEKGCAYFGGTLCNASTLPLLEHFTCVVDSLARAGLIDEVLALIRNMPFHPSIASWHTLLGACQGVWCDSKLGEYAFENALMLDDGDCAAYVSLSNIYAKCKGM